MSIRRNNTSGKYYQKQNEDNASLTNVQYTSIERPLTRVFVTREKVPETGPGFSLTREIMKRPEEHLAPLQTLIERPEDKNIDNMFKEYIFDFSEINNKKKGCECGECRHCQNKKNEILRPKQREYRTMDNIRKFENYKTTFQGSTNLIGNRINGRKLNRIINEAKSYYG